MFSGAFSVHPPAQLPHAVKQQPPPPPAAVVSGSPPPQTIQPQTVTTGQATEIVLPLHPVPLSAISTTTFNSPGRLTQGQARGYGWTYINRQILVFSFSSGAITKRGLNSF